MGMIRGWRCGSSGIEGPRPVLTNSRNIKTHMCIMSNLVSMQVEHSRNKIKIEIKIKSAEEEATVKKLYKYCITYTRYNDR